jgi:serine/threonine-protein kinase
MGVPFTTYYGHTALSALLRMYAATCVAIERAHRTGRVHGDVRASNITVDDLGEVEVTGWSTDAKTDARADVAALRALLSEILGSAEHVAAPELDHLAEWGQSARELAEGTLRFVDGVRDLELRKRLADAHLARAIEAFEARRGDIGARDAARALELDPTSRLAADLIVSVRRKGLPADVAKQIESDRTEAIGGLARVGIWAYVGYLVFGPAFLWLGSGRPGYAIALLVLVGANISLLALHGWTTRRFPEILVVLANAALIALVGHVTNPFLLAPGIAAATAVGLAYSPLYERPKVLVATIAAFAFAVLAPWLAQIAGILPSTVASFGDGVILGAVGLHLKEGGQIVMMVLFVPTLVAAAAGLAHGSAKRERALLHRTYLQAWQLRQNTLVR